MIPKILHFIWIPDFTEAPEYTQVNIEKWSHLNPDYKILIWDESDIVPIIHRSRLDHYRKLDEIKSEKVRNVKKADFARIEIINKFGGVYLDCDLEPHKSLSYFFSKNKLERPKYKPGQEQLDKILKFEKVPVDIKSKKLILSREWKNPSLRLNIFTPRDRSANGIIMSEPNNYILERFLQLHCQNTDKRVLHYLGPHALTVFLQRNSHRFHKDDLSIVPPQHFFWEDRVGKMPKWSISKHMGVNTWGDHSKSDFWNVA